MSRTRTVGIIAAFAGGIGWVGKIVIMTAQGGPDPNSVPESIAFFMGLLGVVVASASTAAYLARTRPMWLRVLGGAGAVLVVGLLVGAGQAGLSALPGDAWIREEAIFGVVGVFVLLAAVTALRRPVDRRETAP
jgi:hypothetical protein